MRSSLVVRASDWQCTSCNGSGFDPGIRRHSGIWGAADEAVLNIVRKKLKIPPQKYKKDYPFCWTMLIKFWCALLAGSLRARQLIVRSSARSWSSSTRWTALTFWDRWVLAASRVTLVLERDVIRYMVSKLRFVTKLSDARKGWWFFVIFLKCIRSGSYESIL